MVCVYYLNKLIVFYGVFIVIGIIFFYFLFFVLLYELFGFDNS